MFWLIHDYVSLSAALSDRLALAFFADLLLSTFLVAYLFARRPIGPVKWPWLIVLALVSTLAFGIAAFVGLNWFFAPAPRPSFTAWWRHV